MAAILQIIGWQRHPILVYRLHLWYGTSLLWSIDTCQNRVSADQITWPCSGLKSKSHRGRVFFEVDRWPSAGFSIGSRAHVRLTCWKQGRIVRKPVNASPGLKSIWIITFSSIKVFLLLCFVYMVIIKLKTEGQTGKRKPHHKTQSKILPLPRLSESGTEQPGQGATLLGWPKSLYYSFKLSSNQRLVKLYFVFSFRTARLLWHVLIMTFVS